MKSVTELSTRLYHCPDCGWIGTGWDCDNNPDRCPVCGKPQSQMKGLTKDDDLTAEELCAAWLAFEDVPMNPETEEIEGCFMGFEMLTPREEIWHWFDERYPGGLIQLMEEVYR